MNRPVEYSEADKENTSSEVPLPEPGQYQHAYAGASPLQIAVLVVNFLT